MPPNRAFERPSICEPRRRTSPERSRCYRDHSPPTRTVVCALAAWVLLLPIAGRASAIPIEAQKVIEQVHAAAANEDFAQLRRLMVRDFQWSFGGDANVDQALDTWKADPKYLRGLKRVTAQQCAFIDSAIVQCPAKGRTNFRAGFGKTADGWRMQYFVEGD